MEVTKKRGDKGNFPGNSFPDTNIKLRYSKRK